MKGAFSTWSSNGAETLQLVLALLVCSASSLDLTIMHTGQTYAQVTAVDLFDVPCMPINGTYISTGGNDPCLGGVDRRGTLVRQVRETVNNSILIDSGVLFTGSLFWYLFNSTVLAKYYAAMSYDAIGLSVYEFQGGIEILAYFIEHDGPTAAAIAANLQNQTADPRLASVPIVGYKLFHFANGDKVGYASTLVQDVETEFANPGPLSSDSELSGLLQAVGTMLDLGVNKIIVTVSSTAILDSVLGLVLGIDIVILSDAFYYNPSNDTQLDYDAWTASYPQVRTMPWGQPVLVVGAGRFGKYLGVLNVTFDENGVLTAWDGNAIQLSEVITADPSMATNITEDYDKMREAMSNVVGQANLTLGFENQCLFGECGIGDWVADVFKKAGGTQIAICNGGSFSGPINSGSITLGSYLLALPYVGMDQLWTFNVTGAVLRQTLEHSVSEATTPNATDTYRFLQVSGVNFTWNPNESIGRRIIDVWVEVEPGMWQLVIDAGQVFSVTAFDYLCQGGDDYTILVTNTTNVINTGVFASEPLLSALQASLSHPLNVHIEGRISETNYTLESCFTGTDLCHGNGYCFQGACVCTVSGTYGSLCAFPSGSSSSNSTGLIIGLVVGISGGLLIAILLSIMIILLWSRKRKKEEQDLLMAEHWSDEDSLELEGTMSDTTSSSSSSIRLGRSLTIDELESFKFTFEPKTLHFGLGPSDRCPIDQEMSDEIVLTNNSHSSRRFKFLVPMDNEKFRSRLYPGTGVIKSGTSVTVHVHVTLLMTTDIERKIKLDIEDVGSYLIKIKLSGEISIKIDPEEIITLPQPLGRGSFGTVYKAMYRGQEVAAKIPNSQLDRRLFEEFQKEVEIMARLRCPYVINFIGASFVPGKVCLVTELCTNGPLSDYVFSDTKFKFPLLLKVAIDMGKAVAFLHANGVLHRDVKPDNFLVISLSTKAPVTVKIADFGTSRSITQAQEPFNHTAALGTPIYMAPEILEHKPYSTKLDVYSFAVTLWVLYVRKEPYSELKHQWDIPVFVIKGHRPSIPDDCPEGYADLIQRCWAADPQQRPEMSEVVQTLESLFNKKKAQETTA